MRHTFGNGLSELSVVWPAHMFRRMRHLQQPRGHLGNKTFSSGHTPVIIRVTPAIQKRDRTSAFAPVTAGAIRSLLSDTQIIR
jgi:hypothetical protein